MVSSMQLATTISDVLPRSSRARTQIVFWPSPITSNEFLLPRDQLLPRSREYSHPRPSELDTSQSPVRVTPSFTLSPVSVKLNRGGARIADPAAGVGPPRVSIWETKPPPLLPPPPQAEATASKPDRTSLLHHRTRYDTPAPSKRSRIEHSMHSESATQI